jgi:TRAP-type C4-dicarboxylate transport system permease small subunit
MTSRLFDGYCRLLNGLLAVALAVMVVQLFGNVVLRYASIPASP